MTASKGWLVCKTCGIKEAILEQTRFVACTECGAARFAEDDAGRALVVWSVPQNPEKW